MYNLTSSKKVFNYVKNHLNLNLINQSLRSTLLISFGSWERKNKLLHILGNKLKNIQKNMDNLTIQLLKLSR